MSSSATPHGATPVGSLVSCAYNAKVTHYKIKNAYGTSIFFGDIVKWADDNPNTTIAKDTGTTACTPIGIFLGCAYTDPTTGQFTPNQYFPASVASDDIVAYVASDPFLIMQMQCDGAADQDDLGKNCAIVQTAGSTAIGRSKVAVDISTVATTSTLPVKIIDFVDGPDSAIGDAYTDVLVVFNSQSAFGTGGHQLLNATGVG
jgi:hypothetical protein|tara:strand:- start:265 stop:873 length:609 start_codon:yes stop_codon:yes gene_type:complete